MRWHRKGKSTGTGKFSQSRLWGKINGVSAERETGRCPPNVLGTEDLRSLQEAPGSTRWGDAGMITGQHGERGGVALKYFFNCCLLYVPLFSVLGPFGPNRTTTLLPPNRFKIALSHAFVKGAHAIGMGGGRSFTLPPGRGLQSASMYERLLAIRLAGRLPDGEAVPHCAGPCSWRFAIGGGVERHPIVHG
jgi:hypothetical protein